jgi:hypothetical protein
MHISVEVCFVDPCDPDGAVTALREHGYRIDKIEDLRDDAEVDAVFVHASRDVTDAEIAGTPDDHWEASCLVLDEAGKLVEPFGGLADRRLTSTALPTRGGVAFLLPLSTETHMPKELKELTVTVLMVVSAVDDGVYGPFSTQTDALAFAEDADGAIFECQARLTSAREI